MSQQFKTHWKKYCNPNYLGAYSLQPGEEPVLTIRQVNREMVKGEGGREEECTVAHFVEREFKPMILNRTNCKTIQKIYGTPYVEEWTGKTIQIFASETKLKGEAVECLRIRPQSPNRKLPEFTPEHPDWEKAVKSLSDGNTSIEKMRKFYTISESTAKFLKEEASNA